MKAYAVDLRTRIVEAVYREVSSQGEGAARFGVSHTVVKTRLRQRRETGSVAPKPPGGGQRPKVEAKKGEAVRVYLLEGKNDASLGEGQAYLARRWKLGGSQATVSRLLTRLGLPRKNNFGGQGTRRSPPGRLARGGGALGPEPVYFCGGDEHKGSNDKTLRARPTRAAGHGGRAPQPRAESVGHWGLIWFLHEEWPF